MTIHEPTTTLTDYALAALCLWFAAALWRQAAESGQRSVRLFAGGFLATAIAAAAGGTSHGFGPQLGPAAHFLLWKSTVLAVGVTAFLFLAAAAVAALGPRIRRVALALGGAQLAVYSVWMLGHDDFIWVILQYVPVMLVVLAIEAREMQRGVPGAGWIVLGIITSLAGAGVQASGFTLHEHFNNNDLYHVIQMAGTVALYRGAKLLRDRRP